MKVVEKMTCEILKLNAADHHHGEVRKGCAAVPAGALREEPIERICNSVEKKKLHLDKVV